MAVRTASAVKNIGWNRSIFFPKDTYVLRITDEEVKPSKAGNPMVKLEYEVCNAEPKQVGDVIIDLNGTKFPAWHVTEVRKKENEKMTDEELEKSSQAAFDRYDAFLQKCGIDTSAGWDPENPPSVLGKCIWASVYGKEDKSRKTPTPEQRAKNEPGDVMIDPITKKEVINYTPTVENVFGPCTDEIKTPF